jgi:hypothetical protein
MGTTHNISGTHRCLNLETLREITGDVFRPALLTPIAVRRLTQLAGSQPPLPSLSSTYEEQLTDATPPYALDPNRGVEEVQEVIQPSSDEVVQLSSDEAPTTEIIQAESVHGDLISDADDVFDVPASEAATETQDTIDQHVDDNYAVLTINEAKLLYGVLMQQQLKNSRIVLRKMYGISYLRTLNRQALYHPRCSWNRRISLMVRLKGSRGE